MGDEAGWASVQGGERPHGFHDLYVLAVAQQVDVSGLGLAITVAPLTAAALAAVPARHAGRASAVNNDVARTAALIAVAVLPAAAGLTGTAYLHPARFSAGFGTAALTIRNPGPQARPAPPRGRSGTNS